MHRPPAHVQTRQTHSQLPQAGLHAHVMPLLWQNSQAAPRTRYHCHELKVKLRLHHAPQLEACPCSCQASKHALAPPQLMPWAGLQPPIAQCGASRTCLQTLSPTLQPEPLQLLLDVQHAPGQEARRPPPGQRTCPRSAAAPAAPVRGPCLALPASAPRTGARARRPRAARSAAAQTSSAASRAPARPGCCRKLPNEAISPTPL